MKYTILDDGGFNCGEYSDLDSAIARCNELAGNPSLPDSQRDLPKHYAGQVYGVKSDECGGGSFYLRENF